MNSLFAVSAVALAFSTLALGDQHFASATDIVQQAKQDCGSFDEGEFSATEQTITLHDFTGDGRPEELVDGSQFACSTAASLWGGSGGTLLWAVVAGKAYEFAAHQWQVVDVGKQKVLLLAVHSSECSDTPGPCYRAYVWAEDGFSTTR